MESTNHIDTGQSESTEDKEAVCDESDIITESIETLETSDTMGQKDRALHSNSDLSEGNLSDGKSDSYEIGSKCDGSPKKVKGNKNLDSKVKDVEKDMALKGAESNVAMGTDTSDKSQAKKEKRKRDRKKRKQNKKERAMSLTEGGEEKENNLHKVDSSETDISEKDEIVKVKDKSESKPKKENGKKRKNSVVKKGEKCNDMNENNLDSGEQIISLSGSQSVSREFSSDSEQLRSDSANSGNSGNEETYDIGKDNSDTKVLEDSREKEEKPQRNSNPTKKKKKKKKLKNVQSVDEADDNEGLNQILEISKSPTSKQSGEKDSSCDSQTSGNTNLTSAEQTPSQEQTTADQPHSIDNKADNSQPPASSKKGDTTDEIQPSEPTSENSKQSEPQTSKQPTSDVVAKETTDDVTEMTSEEPKSVTDDVTEVTSTATTDIKELLSEIKDVLSEFPGDNGRESSVDPEDHFNSSNQKPDVTCSAEMKSGNNSMKDISCEETNPAKINNSTPKPEVKTTNESSFQQGTEVTEKIVQDVNVNSEDTAEKNLTVEKRSEKLETESETLPEKLETESETLPEKLETESETLPEKLETESETLPEKLETESETLPEKLETESETLLEKLETESETLPEKSETSEEKHCEKSQIQSESNVPDSLCKNVDSNHSAMDNSESWNSEVKDVLSNMVDNVHENLKSSEVPKMSESVVPDHVDLSDIEDGSVDSVGSEDLPQSQQCDSEIHVPLNPSKLRDELVKLESENLSVIADLEKDASLLESHQSTDDTDIITSQSKEDNSQTPSSTQKADEQDSVVMTTNSYDSSVDILESSVDCVDGVDGLIEVEANKVKDAVKSELVTKPVISVQDVGVETDVDEEKIQMREELERLKEELSSTKDALQKSQSQVYRHQIHSNLTVSTLQAQLHKKDMEMKQKQIGHDQQIEAIISRLFLLEGEIRREQKQILGLLELKETVIDKQSNKIEELINTNDKLSMALKLHNIGTNGLVTPLNRSTGDLSPSNKTSFKDKESPKNMKLRWGTMKDKLRRHKSSFELHHPDRMETLEEGRFRYGSQENLSNSKRVNDRKERCRSYAEYPQSLRNSPLVELPNENDYQKSDGSETTSLNMAEGSINDGQCSPSSSSDDNSIISDMSSIGPRRGSITSLPNGIGLGSTNRGSSPNIYKDVRELSPHEKPVKQSSPSSNHHGESNPFKSIKTMLKRRGSKLRSKKRNAADSNDSEPKEALKNHFKKYEMQ